MNQNDKDAALKYTSENKAYSPVIPTRQTVMDEQSQAFLAGIQYERNRQSEVERAGLEKWAGLAQGMKDAKDGK
jgi:hypothetical protein